MFYVQEQCRELGFLTGQTERREEKEWSLDWGHSSALSLCSCCIAAQQLTG